MGQHTTSSLEAAQVERESQAVRRDLRISILLVCIILLALGALYLLDIKTGIVGSVSSRLSDYLIR